MREIKFRAWDEELERWSHFTFDALIIGAATRKPLAHWSQYTGLKDKNGVEIYEGDVVEFSNIDTSNPPLRLPVIWDEKATGFHCDDGKNQRGVDMAAGYDTISGEVIGNIYEHKHLLDESTG